MSPEQEALVSQIESALRSDARFEAAWLAGSIGRGSHDSLSDIDILTVVRPDTLTAVIADWPDQQATISPTVWSHQRVTSASAVLNHVTPDWQRYDIVVVTPDQLVGRAAPLLTLLFDDHGHSRRLAAQPTPREPSGQRTSALTSEFLRVLGLATVVIGREDWITGASGAGLLRSLLIQLMSEELRVADRGGALSTAGMLPPVRRQQLQGLPPISAERQSVVAAHLACAELFLPLARSLCRQTQTPWPAAFDEATRRHLHTQLGWKLRDEYSAQSTTCTP